MKKSRYSEGLLFVLNGSAWKVRNNQLHCFAFRHLEQPFRTWMENLQKSTVPDIFSLHF